MKKRLIRMNIGRFISIILALGLLLTYYPSGLAITASADPSPSWGLDYTDSFTDIDKMLKNPENVVPTPFDEWSMNDFSRYNKYSGQRLLNATGTGSIEVEAPEGQYYFGVVIIAKDGTDPTLSLKLNGEVKAEFRAPYPDNRYYLYFTETPVNFNDDDMMAVDANGNQARVAGFVFTKDKPDATKRGYSIDDVAAVYQPGFPYRTDGKTAIRFTWTTTWATTGTIEITGGDLDGTLTIPFDTEGRLHHIDWFDFEPNETYSWTIKTTDLDGNPVTSGPHTVTASLPENPESVTDTQTIALPVNNNSDTDLTKWPTRTSVPLAEGALFSDNHVRVVDKDGVPVLAQTSVLARWDDGSVRWLQVEFITDVEAGETKDYTLQYGQSVEKESSDNLVAESDGIYEIDTDYLKVQIDPENISIPGDIWMDLTGSGTYSGDPLTEKGMASVTNTNDMTFTSMGAAEEVRVESEGPVRATIYVKGHLTRLNYPISQYEFRIHAFKDSPLLWLEYTLGNDNTGFMKVSSATLDIPMKEVVESVKIGGDNDSVHEVNDLTSPAILSQMRDSSYTVTGGASGSRADGWVELDTDTAATTIATRYFWQNYPKQIEISQDKISIDVMPPFQTSDYETDVSSEIEKDQLYYHMQEDSYKLSAGMSVRNEFLLAFGQEGSHVPTEYVNSALKADLDRDVFVQSEVFGAMSEDPGHFSTLLNQVSATHINTFKNVLDEQRAYGMLNFGDSWGERGFNWTNLEYDLAQGLLSTYAHTGNEDAFILAEQSALHQMNIDIKRVHGDPELLGHQTKHSMGHVGVYFKSKPSYASSAQIGSEGDLGHSFISGLVSYYEMTGDRMALESAIKVADQLIGFDRDILKGFNQFKDWTFDYDRYIGWPLLIYASAYEATGDPYYLNASRLMIREAIDTQAAEGAWAKIIVDECKSTIPSQCYGMMTYQFGIFTAGILEYYKLTGDETIPPMFVKAVQAFLDYNYDEEGKDILYHGESLQSKKEYWDDCVAPALAAAYEFTKDDPTLTSFNEKVEYVFIRHMISRMEMTTSGDNGKNLGMFLRFDPLAMKTADEIYETIPKVSVESINVEPSDIEIEVGERYDLLATVLPSDALYGQVEWTSSNTTIATVSSAGRVVGRSAGTAVITANVYGKKSSVVVTVTNPVPDESGQLITINPATAPMGDTLAGRVWFAVNVPDGADAPVITVYDSNNAVVEPNLTGTKNGFWYWKSEALKTGNGPVPGDTYTVVITARLGKATETYTASFIVGNAGIEPIDQYTNLVMFDEERVMEYDPVLFIGEKVYPYESPNSHPGFYAKTEKNVYTTAVVTDSMGNEIGEDQQVIDPTTWTMDWRAASTTPVGDYNLTVTALSGGITETYTATITITETGDSDVPYTTTLSNGKFKTEYAEFFEGKPSHNYDGYKSFAINFKTLPVAKGTTNSTNPAEGMEFEYRALEHITPSYEILLNGVKVDAVSQIDGDTGEGTITVSLDASLNDNDAIVYTLTPGNTFASGFVSGGYVYSAPTIDVKAVSNGNEQSNIDFNIRSANGKGYKVFMSDTGEDATFTEYKNVNYNSRGAHIKGLTNDKTYYAYIVYSSGGVYEESPVVVLSPGK